jgi:hypothetical protein
VCSNDQPGYTGGSVATLTASHARQVGGKKPDEQATHQPSRIAGGWG